LNSTLHWFGFCANVSIVIRNILFNLTLMTDRTFFRVWAALTIVLSSPIPIFGQDIEALPQTKPLDWQESDLSARLMDGAHRFIERKIDECIQKRKQYWHRDFSSQEAYAKSIQPNRAHFQTIIGAADSRLPARMERFGDDSNPALVAETPRYRVYQVRWPVLDGLFGHGLLVEPKQPAKACVVALPDADQTPEQLMGLAAGISMESQGARLLAENGFELVLPTLVSREKLQTDDKQLKASDQTNREWIYRQAYHMGRHVIGFEVQMVMAAVDWFRERHGEKLKIGVCGYGEGGLIAFYAVAVDPRIDATLVSGYFDSRQKVWAEPIYRNVWGLLHEFGDAEVASLILPRSLIIEHSTTPTILNQKGELHTPEFASVKVEFDRIESGPNFPRPSLVSGPSGKPATPFSSPAVAAFARALGTRDLTALPEDNAGGIQTAFNPALRQRDLVHEMETYVQNLVRESDKVRNKFFLYSVMPELAESQWSTARRHPTHPPEKFIEGAKPFRQKFWEEGMGRFDDPLLPFNPRTRKVAESPKWIAYDVVLDVFPDLSAWGVLVLPKDLKPGERRPVVVCQHGRNGLPRDTLDANNSAYNNFAGALAEQGFITFAPHNLYRGEDRYRWLCRKANTVKGTLFSFIIAQHDQILRWLATLPNVDAEHIAFYGLSYGGETAVRVPAILEKYCLSICSGDFNQWTHKVAATDEPFSFMRTIEWEMPYWNLGHTFDYAEMTYLMVPRPFMVERGHLDRVGVDSWVSYEYAKTRWLYAQLGMEDRTQIEYFQGGHSINGEGTFEFLHKYLNWPAK
jgi:dienelactone hydrolase